MMNLTHRFRWFLRQGGADAEVGGADGIGGLKKHGGSIRGLSRTTGRSRNTIRRYLRGGDGVSKRKPGPKRIEKLDPFKAYIVDRLKAALPDRIPATVLYREVKERG